jgi:peptide/nickel transport system permease protein
MLNYLLIRALYAIPVLIGVNLITFLLFFAVNNPDDIARSHLGSKYITQESIDHWKDAHDYNMPLFYNSNAQGVEKITNTLFFDKSARLFVFDFGMSDNDRNIGFDISERMWASLALAVPVLLIGVMTDIIIALLIVFFRSTYLDLTGVIVCTILMSISGLFYIIFGQYIVGKLFNLAPISGYEYGLYAWKFLLLPVVIGVVSGIGAGVRWYRTLFLEEVNKDYVRTARAKGLSELCVLFKHVLKNGMIPILTGIVVIIPSLFLGSLLMETFFGIPGLGSYTIDAISTQDYAVVRTMVFLGTVLYILGLIMTDISYTLVDPRVRLQR